MSSLTPRLSVICSKVILRKQVTVCRLRHLAKRGYSNSKHDDFSKPKPSSNLTNNSPKLTICEPFVSNSVTLHIPCNGAINVQN